MTPFKSILVATDFSVPANNAVRRAALLASQHGVRLCVVHVVVPPSRVHVRRWLLPVPDLDGRLDNAHRQLQELAVELKHRYDLTPSIELRTGEVREELHRASARADLLVLGQRSRSALVEMVLGSTAQRLVECSRRPVLVVKQEAQGSYRRALVPIDFTPASDAAAFVAATLAPDLDMQVFHALDSTIGAVMHDVDVNASVIRESLAKEENIVLARMRRSMTRLGLDSRKLRFAVGRGSPVKATLRQAQSLNADVLVATKLRRGRVATSVLGSINSLLARSPCDMLMVSGWVRDPRQPQPAAALRPVARAVGISMARADRAHATPGSSWMRSQLPAEACMARQDGRPQRAGG